MADVQDDLPAHLQTYQSFNKLVLFAILFIVLLLSCMALGLVGSASPSSPCCSASAAPWRC